MDTDNQAKIERAYAQAKQGDWARLMAAWQEDPAGARRLSRYQEPTSGWTALHQAAYFGREDAARALIGLGASTLAVSRDGKTAADIASERGFGELEARLRHAATGTDSLWAPPRDPDLLPSSCLYSEASPRQASEAVKVAYGGSYTTIRAGSRYFVDTFGRVLVGWHGTYDPPSGMDAEPLFDP